MYYFWHPLSQSLSDSVIVILSLNQAFQATLIGAFFCCPPSLNCEPVLAFIWLSSRFILNWDSLFVQFPGNSLPRCTMPTDAQKQKRPAGLTSQDSRHIIWYGTLLIRHRFPSCSNCCPLSKKLSVAFVVAI